MLRFSANITYLFQEIPFLERVEAAAEAGFEAIEIPFPYDDATSEILRRMRRHDMPLSVMNTPPPNWTGGARGFAAAPDRVARFRVDFRRCLRYAERLRPAHIHVMAGVTDDPAARQVFIDNLCMAADQAPDQSLVIEPMNTEDMPGYYLSSFELAREILTAVNRPNVGLQFDLYHAQMITGDALGCWAEVAHLTRSIQIAGTPERRSPDQGTVDIDAFFAAVAASSFAGFVAAEYKPEGPTHQSLGWLKREPSAA